MSKKSLTITKTYDNIKAHRNSVHKSKMSKQKTKKDLQKDVDKYTKMMYNKDKLKNKRHTDNKRDCKQDDNC